MQKASENVGTFVWHNLTHSVRVCRDYLNYSEHGMPYVVDHFVLTVTDVNGNEVSSPLTETGYRSYMLARSQSITAVQLIVMNQLAMRSSVQLKTKTRR